MSKLTVVAGDFPFGTASFTIRNFTLPGDDNHYLCETVKAEQVSNISHASHEFILLMDKSDETKEFIRNATEDDVFFLAKLKDNRRFVGSTDQRTFDKILKAVTRAHNKGIDEAQTAA